MTKYSWLLLAAMGLSSCMGTRKYASIVEQRVQTEQLQPQQRDWLVVNTPGTTGNQLKQLERSFIPALLYWGWNSTISCELDPATSAAFVRRGMYQAADNLGLEQRLAGRQLVIDIQQAPGQFMYENKGSVIYLFMMHITTAEEAITPRPTNLVLQYRLLENGAVVASGEHIIRNEEEKLRNVWKSSKKFTWLYLDLFEREADRMGAESMKDILREIDSNYSRL